MEEKYLTITALTKYLKFKFDNDENLRLVYLKGEISNFKRHSTGHLYFSLKDENSKINAIMFNNSASKLLFEPVEGSKVLVIGRVSVYESTGNYQIYVNEMIEDGIGNLYIEFEKLKEKLSKEGLFNQDHKKKLPKYPNKIGIVTAETGAAIKDILTTINRRYNMCELYLFPCLVQGENASNDICKKLKQADSYNLDLIITGRGGGSIEDLWPFNEENVARTIYDMKTPVISAVGHEIDFTIADLVADLRAPTPTAAGELAVPNINDLINEITQYNIRLNESINKKIKLSKLKMDTYKNSYTIKNPMLMFENKKQKIDLLNEKLIKSIKYSIDMIKNKISLFKKNHIIINPNILYKDKITKLNTLIEKTEIINPLSVLKRGYSVTYKDNKTIKSINDINIKDNLKIRISDGFIDVNVVGKEK